MMWRTVFGTVVAFALSSAAAQADDAFGFPLRGLFRSVILDFARGDHSEVAAQVTLRQMLALTGRKVLARPEQPRAAP